MSTDTNKRLVMCYEFVQACEKQFISRISLLIGEDNFFLFCIGHLNYLYCTDKNSVGLVKQLLNEKGIALHHLSEKETLGVVNTPFLQEYEVFYGSQPLFEGLQEKWAMA